MQETSYGPQSRPMPVRRPRRFGWLPRRKMTWALIGWTTIFAVWLIAGISDAHGIPAECKNDPYLSPETCNAAADTGTAIGAGLVLMLWFIGFVVLSIIWFMSRPKPANG